MATTKALELAQLADSISVNANGEITNIGTLSSLDISGQIDTSTLTVSGDFTVDTNTFHVDAVDNFVGIGTSTPSDFLHLDGDVAGSIRITLDNANTSGFTTFRFQEDGNARAAFYYSNASSTFNFQNAKAGGTFRMQTTDANNVTGTAITIDGDRNVTFSDGSVTIDNNLTVAGDLTVNGNTTTVSTNNLVIEDLNITLANGVANSSLADGAGITIDGANATILYDGTNDEWDFNKPINVTGGIVASSTIVSGRDVYIADDRYLRWSAQATGSTGGFLFGDSSGTGGSLTFYRNSDSADILTLLANGNVGVNTDVPHHKFQVVGKAQIGETSSDWNNSDDTLAVQGSLGIYFASSPTTENMRLGLITGSPASWGIQVTDSGDGGNHLVLQNAQGGVLIGTTTQGTLSDGDLGVAGKVGVGTTSPAHQLDVAGDINAQGALRAEEVRHSVRPNLLMDFANTKDMGGKAWVSRSSTATYWDGRTSTLSEQNLILYSQDFGNWTQYNVSVATDSVTAPDGTTTADAITPSNATNYVRRSWSQLYASTEYTASVYLKAPSATTVNFRINRGDDTFSSNGVSVGTSWTRTTVTFTTTASVPYAKIDLIGTNGETFHVWGVQVEKRATASTYTATTSSPVNKFQPVLQTTTSQAQPRFEHNPVTGECKGLLIEAASTNLNPYSVLDTGWTPQNGTRTVNAAIAPDGTQTAMLFEDDDSGPTFHSVYRGGISVTSGLSYTISCYVKAVRYHIGAIRLYDGAGMIARGSFDLINETVSVANGTNSTIENVGNGWYRVSITGTANQTTTSADIQVFTTSQYTHVGSGGERSLLFWGFQLEQKDYPTSYIPTNGSQVTRNSEVSVFTETDWFKHDEGTLYAEQIVTNIDKINQTAISIYGGSGHQIALGLGTGGIADVNAFYIQSDAIDQIFKYGSTLSVGDVTKGAGAWKYNNSVAAFDGVASTVDTSVYVTPNVEAIRIGQVASGSYSGDTIIKKIAFYPKALSSDELVALTEA